MWKRRSSRPTSPLRGQGRKMASSRLLILTGALPPNPTVCSCGAGSCSPTQCRDYPINQCVQAYNLCDGTPNGYVTITQSGSNYVGNFYCDSQGQTTAVASFSAPCGVQHRFAGSGPMQWRQLRSDAELVARCRERPLAVIELLF